MLSRRQFTTGIGASLTMATQISQSASPARARSQAHHRRCAGAYLAGEHAGAAVGAGRTVPGPVETFTIERLLGMMDEAGVDRAVIAPPTLDRCATTTGSKRRSAIPIASRSWAAFRSTIRRRSSCLPRWKEQPGMLGIRLAFGGESAQKIKDGGYDWLLCGVREGRRAADVFRARALAGFCPHRRAASAARAHRRSCRNEPFDSDRRRRDRYDRAGQISQRVGEDEGGRAIRAGALSLSATRTCSSNVCSRPTGRSAATGKPTSPRR